MQALAPPGHPAEVLAIVGVIGALMCAGVIGGCGVATKKVIDDVNKRQEEQKRKEKDRAAYETRAVAPNESSRTGFAKAKVKSAVIAPVEIDDFGTMKQSVKSYLIVTLELSMTDDKKRWEFTGWTTDKKLASDALGNSYHRPTFGFLASIPNEITKETIIAGKPVVGTLVFDEPPPGITELNLDLPAHGVEDGTGYFRFKIPASMWKEPSAPKPKKK